MSEPIDKTCMLHRPPLHLKVEHVPSRGFRVCEMFYPTLFIGNLTEPARSTIDAANEYAQLVWVKLYPEDEIEQATTLEAIRAAFDRLDVAKILERALSEEEAALRVAEATLRSAQTRLERLRAARVS